MPHTVTDPTSVIYGGLYDKCQAKSHIVAWLTVSPQQSHTETDLTNVIYGGLSDKVSSHVTYSDSPGWWHPILVPYMSLVCH